MVLGIKGYLLATVIQSIMILKLVIPYFQNEFFVSLLSKKNWKNIYTNCNPLSLHP